ncbi:hypothetical protein A4U42_10395 [Dickeya solani IPO 2222]|nr:hypothetical protein A4U42_10395 [Dickeya solani IPO 2222]
MLAKFQKMPKLWITLCKIRYKRCFCCGMQRTRDLIKNTGCGLRGTPYNAPPLTRQQRKRSAVSGRENEKKVVDSAGGKRSIRHLATAGCKPVAPLFNNQSDNLCGHSQDTSLKNYVKVLKSDNS